MRLNLSDAVDDLALPPPPCFFNRSSWMLYLKSAAAAQNHKGTAPSPGAVEGDFGTFSTPGDGDHLEKPSTAQRSGDVQEVEGVQERWANIEQDDDAASSRREAAPRPTRPRRRPKGPGLDDAQRVPQPPDPTAQLELLLPEEVG